MDNKYLIVLENNTLGVLIELDRTFHKNQEYIRYELLSKINDLLLPSLPHYEWFDDYCAYDNSGSLIQEGFINKELTVKDFLKEYTGVQEYTGAFNYRYSYPTYERTIRSYCIEIEREQMREAVVSFLEDEFNEPITEDFQAEIMENLPSDLQIVSEHEGDLVYKLIIGIAEIQDVQLKDIDDMLNS